MQLPEVSRDGRRPPSPSPSRGRACWHDGSWSSRPDHRVSARWGQMRWRGLGPLAMAVWPRGPRLGEKRNFKLFVLLLFGGFCLSQQNYTIHFPTLAPHTLFLWRADGENKQTSTLPTLSHSTPSPREPLPAPQIKAPAHSTALAGPEPAPGLLHTSRPQSQTDGHWGCFQLFTLITKAVMNILGT